MINVQEAFPECQKDDEYSWLNNRPGYSEIVAKFGEVLHEVQVNDYQGDTLVLLQKGDEFGVLKFGWGSCSGCDALQACYSISDLQDLVDRLESSIDWRTKDATVKYLKEHDWEGDYSWHYEELKAFPPGALQALGVADVEAVSE